MHPKMIQAIPLMALSFLRVWGMGSMLTFLNLHAGLSTLGRQGLLMVFTLPIFLTHLQDPPLDASDLSLIAWVAVVIQEVMVGALIGFICMVPFWAIDLGCFLIDTLRGTSMSAALNPVLGTQSSGLGIFFTQLLSLLFLASDGLHGLLTTLYRSYTLLPVGAVHLTQLGGWQRFVKEALISMFELGLSFAMPALVIMLLIDMALGLLSLGASQINVFFLAMPIKSILCLLLMATSLKFSMNVTLLHFQRLWQTIFLLFEG